MFYFVFKSAAENTINSIFIEQSLVSFSSDSVLVMKEEKSFFLCARARKMLLFEVMVESGQFVHKISMYKHKINLRDYFLCFNLT